jgi:hypothetical protein
VCTMNAGTQTLQRVPHQPLTWIASVGLAHWPRRWLRSRTVGVAQLKATCNNPYGICRRVCVRYRKVTSVHMAFLLWHPVLPEPELPYRNTVLTAQAQADPTHTSPHDRGCLQMARCRATPATRCSQHQVLQVGAKTGVCRCSSARPFQQMAAMQAVSV